MAFLENLERLCYERGESMNGVAKAIGVNSGAVTKWKTGSKPRNSTLKLIADHFGVTVDYLLSDEAVTPGKWDSKKESDEFLPLSSMEKVMLELFRKTTDRGRMKMIQRVMNVAEEEK